ncbi:MAG: isoprenylcysteine carboxylmethyltransferase family protein [Hyphomicrobium sp.]|nr:isoprenylcysteine carboxylmethyltransferase family protein [Hyphomicrobium sp.]
MNELADKDVQRPGTIPWPPLLMIGLGGAAVASQSLVPVSWPGLDDGAARVIGLGFGIIGVTLIVWTAITLNRHRTTILPNKGATSLVTDGPFRWRRNPIYLGEILLLLGAAELTKNVWFVAAAAIFGIAVTILQIIPEERHLEAKFGEAWRAYAARTRRLL